MCVILTFVKPLGTISIIFGTAWFIVFSTKSMHASHALIFHFIAIIWSPIWSGVYSIWASTYRERCALNVAHWSYSHIQLQIFSKLKRVHEHT